MDKKEFRNRILACRRRLNLACLLKTLATVLPVGAAAGILVQILALVTPLYAANAVTALFFLAAVLTAAAVACRRRCTMERAALAMDGFGLEERVITAWEHLEDEDPIYEIQRRDAMEKLKENSGRIRIPLMPGRKRTALALGTWAAVLALALVPSETKEQAKELYQVRKEAGEQEEEIRETLKELEEIGELAREDLTQEQLETLKELSESLQASLEEYGRAQTPQEMQAAEKKLDFRYETLNGELAGLIRSLQGNPEISPLAVQTMQEMADQARQRNQGTDSGEGSDFAGNGGQTGGQGTGAGDEGGQGTGAGDEEGQGAGTGDEGGQGAGAGDEGGQGAGAGDEGGQGAGAGDEGGQGAGTGDEGGQGAGRGTGSTHQDRDYISIPNDVADREALSGNAGNHDDSDYFRAPNGLDWEGEHVSYDAVIGDYEENAYQGIAAGRYPSGMESVIRDYFSGFH